MTKFISFLFLLNPICLFGQQARIDTLIIPTEHYSRPVSGDKMNYPIIRTGNDQIDSVINWDLKNRLTREEFLDDHIDSALIKWAYDRVSYLDFKVTYNQKGILSLNLDVEWCGAYCTQWTDYFNYSLITSEPIKIESVLDTSSGFRMMVFKEFHFQYLDQLDVLNTDLENGDIDQGELETALEYYEDCYESFNLRDFSLTNEGIEIIKACYVPHYMKPLTPFFELRYEYSTIKKYLKIGL
jgi:hypothetical protein